jgi:hypothetical protein
LEAFRILTWDFSVIDLLLLILGGCRSASMSESALRVSFFGSCYCAACHGILLSLLQRSFLYGYQSPCHNYPYCRTRRWRFRICTCATQFVQLLPRYYMNRNFASISQALLLICAIFTYLVREIGQKAFQGSVFNTTRLLYVLIIYILSREIQLSYYSNTIKDRKVGLAVLP